MRDMNHASPGRTISHSSRWTRKYRRSSREDPVVDGHSTMAENAKADTWGGAPG